MNFFYYCVICDKNASFEKFAVTWITAECLHCDGRANIDGQTFKNSDFNVSHPFKGNI